MAPLDLKFECKCLINAPLFFLPSTFMRCVYTRGGCYVDCARYWPISLLLFPQPLFLCGKKRSPSSSSPPQPTASVVAEKVVVSSPSLSLKFQRARPRTHYVFNNSAEVLLSLLTRSSVHISQERHSREKLSAKCERGVCSGCCCVCGARCFCV